MRNNTHTKFILTPILSILKESIIACRGIGVGIETQALSEYVMQTTFLKMTGALEQKMKCICWEIASNDYEYRYQYLKKNYGECSSYNDKNHVYNDLINAIARINRSFNWHSIFFDIDITPIVKESLKTKIGALLLKKNLYALKAKYDHKKVGGAPLLGVSKIVLKCHGNSKAESICATIEQAYILGKNKLIEKVTKAVSNEEK